jgi:hypothetical protein
MGDGAGVVSESTEGDKAGHDKGKAESDKGLWGSKRDESDVGEGLTGSAHPLA